jgi:hypothetical protein
MGERDFDLNTNTIEDLSNSNEEIAPAFWTITVSLWTIGGGAGLSESQDNCSMGSCKAATC